MTRMLDAVGRRSELDRSYRACKSIARRTGRNFYFSFLVLPPPQRRAMCALYAFLRRTDDLADSGAPIEQRRRDLEDWRRNLDRVLAGTTTADAWGPALADTVRRYRIPPALLEEVVEGVAGDLVVDRYETFEDLSGYCYKVASAVGLACIRIWGVEDERSRPAAEACGIAFQLTNILRDLAEDYRRGRIYLPQEELRRFGVAESELGAAAASAAFLELMRFQVRRADEYYERAASLFTYLSPAGRAILAVMIDLYRGLLRKIERRPADVLRKRVTLSTPRKLVSVLRALPARYLDRGPTAPASGPNEQSD